MGILTTIWGKKKLVGIENNSCRRFVVRNGGSDLTHSGLSSREEDII